LEDHTEWFYKELFLPLKDILVTDDVSYETNNIIQRTGIIVGGQGSGKSMIARAICEEADRFYGQHNVNPVWSRNLSALVYGGCENVAVNILYYDDATLVKVKNDVLRDFFRIRHIAKDITTRSNGLIINIIGTHRYFSIPKDLRAGCAFLIFKDTPMNPFDYNTTERFIGKESMQFLDSLTFKKYRERELMGWSVFWFRHKVGAMYSTMPEYNSMTELKVT
jgi:hypothetical protein